MSTYTGLIKDEDFLNVDLTDDVTYIIQEYLKSNMHTAITGVIDSFDPTNQRARVQINIKGRRRVDDGESVKLTPYMLSPLIDVPCHIPQGGGFCLTFPVKKGDECLIVFTERDISNWKEFGGIQEVSLPRFFDRNGAVAIIGFNSLPNSIQNYNNEDVQLRDAAGEQSVTLKANNDILLKSPTKIILDAPETNITQKLTVGADASFAANVDITGNLTVSGGGTFSLDVMIGNISYLGHKHVGNKGKPTSPPTP